MTQLFEFYHSQFTLNPINTCQPAQAKRSAVNGMQRIGRIGELNSRPFKEKIALAPTPPLVAWRGDSDFCSDSKKPVRKRIFFFCFYIFQTSSRQFHQFDSADIPRRP